MAAAADAYDYETGDRLTLTWRYRNAREGEDPVKERPATVQKEVRGTLYLDGRHQEYRVKPNGEIFGRSSARFSRYLHIGSLVDLQARD